MSDTTFTDKVTTVVASWLNAVNRLIYDIGSSTGSSLVGHVGLGTGAAINTLKDKVRESVSILDFYANGLSGVTVDPTGVVDSTLGIQAAINASAGKILLWPRGNFLITKCLNVTNRGSTPTIWKGSGFNFDMSDGTIIIARTAVDGTLSPGWIVDFTGSQNITIEEINFWGNGTNASIKGLLFARSSIYKFAQQHRLVKVCVRVGSSAGASSLGSIAIANSSCEQLVHDQLSLEANCPYVIMLSNEVSLVSPYALIDVTNVSSTIQEHRQCTYKALDTAASGAAMHVYGIADSRWINCVWAKGGVSLNTVAYAIALHEGVGGYVHCQSLELDGHVEIYPSALTFADGGMTAYRINTHLFLAAPSGVSPFVQTAASVNLYGCFFDNQQSETTSGWNAIAFGATSAIHGGEIVLYPGMKIDSGAWNSALNYGCRINYHTNGTGLFNLTTGTNITSLATPDAASSWLDSEGFVHLAGLLQGVTATVVAGATVANIPASHRPNRSIRGACFVSGVGLTYLTITVAGDISIGVNLVVAAQIDFALTTFKQNN